MALFWLCLNGSCVVRRSLGPFDRTRAAFEGTVQGQRLGSCKVVVGEAENLLPRPPHRVGREHQRLQGRHCSRPNHSRRCPRGNQAVAASPRSARRRQPEQGLQKATLRRHQGGEELFEAATEEGEGRAGIYGEVPGHLSRVRVAVRALFYCPDTAPLLLLHYMTPASAKSLSGITSCRHLVRRRIQQERERKKERKQLRGKPKKARPGKVGKGAPKHIRALSVNSTQARTGSKQRTTGRAQTASPVQRLLNARAAMSSANHSPKSRALGQPNNKSNNNRFVTMLVCISSRAATGA